MKKIFALIMPVIAMFALTSCHDDDDLPDVAFNVQIENAVRADGKVYVVQGQDFEVSAITVENHEAGKRAMITNANFYWDSYYIGSAVQPPFGFEISVEPETPVGRHTLDIECPLYAEGKEPATALVYFTVEVVASADDLPETGETAFTVTPTTTANSD